MSRVLYILAILVLVGFYAGLRGHSPAHAAASRVAFSQTCSHGKSNLTINWEGNDPAAWEQWIDLSTSDDGFRAGTFLSAGPIASRTTTYIWDGLEPNTTHYLRINQLLPDGRWDPSRTIRVTTACGLEVAAKGVAIEILGFADRATAEGLTPPGGTLRSCNPSRLYAFLRIGLLPSLTDFTYQWAVGGALSQPNAFALEAGPQNHVFSISHRGSGWPAASFSFTLRSGGDSNSQIDAQGGFNLEC